MKLNARLTTGDIDNLIREVENFKYDLQRKLADFVIELADLGITIAKANTYVEYDDEYKDMGDMLEFSKETTISDDEVTCTLTVTGQVYTKTWQGGSAEVNPLLMAEFGSGWRAIEGHQGTFPNQHVAFMRPWHWTDSSGQRHESYGGEPSRPMFKAKEEMEKQIREVAERVFKA